MFCPHHQAWGRNPAFNETVFYYLLSDPNKAKAKTYYEEHPPRACGPGGDGFEPYDPVIWDEEKKQPVGWNVVAAAMCGLPDAPRRCRVESSMRYG